MEGFFVLLLLCLAMFLGCYLAGMVPLSFNLPESRLRLITIFGAGLLVGTALAVIIPEGVAAIYSDGSSHEGHDHDTHEPAVAGILDQANGAAVKKLGELPDKPPDKYEEAPSPPKLDTAASVRVKREEPVHKHAHSENHRVIGFALVLGFVFMLIVDQIGSMGAKRADGIALGAASTTKHSEIQLIVFVAIMLHKAPAAFGLVTFLQYEGLDKSRIKKHLLFFALAAPLAAITTYIGILQGGSQALSSVTSTGILMLFSAGTFLYVATVHVLPEIVQQGQPPVEGGGGHSHGVSGFKANELLAIVTGALVPAFLTLGHSH